MEAYKAHIDLVTMDQEIFETVQYNFRKSHTVHVVVSNNHYLISDNIDSMYLDI